MNMWSNILNLSLPILQLQGKGSKRRYCLVKGIRPLLGQKNKIRVPSTIRAEPCVTEGDTVGSSFSRWAHPSPASFSAGNSYSQLYLLRNPQTPIDRVCFAGCYTRGLPPPE